MTALTKSMQKMDKKISRYGYTLKQGEKAFAGGNALGDPSTGKVLSGGSHSGALFLGVFHKDDVDASSSGTNADTPVVVDHLQEITAIWRDNDGSIAASDRFNPCYVVDDHTVSKTSTQRALMGTILDVDSTFGVLVAVGRPFLENT